MCAKIFTIKILNILQARSVPNFDALNNAAKRLRLERQKSEEIQMQIREQRTQLTMIDSRNGQYLFRWV